jgi:hypothetical protein
MTPLIHILLFIVIAALPGTINAYCRNAEAMMPLYTALRRNILDLFNEYGVQITTPAYESDPAQPKLVPKEQWYAPPARREDSK